MRSMQTSEISSKSLHFFEARFETVGFRVWDRKLILSLAEEVGEKLRGLEVRKGDQMRLRVCGCLPVQIHVTQAIPERGRITETTQIKLYPLLRSEKTANNEKDDAILNLTIAPDDQLKLLWQNLIGIDDIKRKLLEHLVLCLDRKRIFEWCERYHPNALSKMSLILTGFKGKILLVGPSGTGKTCFARGLADALARRIGRQVALVEVGLLRDKLVGETSKKVIRLFQKVRELTSDYVVLLFFDEFDAVATSRTIEQQHDEVRASVNLLLQEMERISPSDGILVIAATNLPELVDFAMDRRFDYIVEFNKPDFRKRIDLLRNLLAPFGRNFGTIIRLAKLTDGRSQADIVRFIREAIEKAILSRRPLNDYYLFEALESTSPARDVRCNAQGGGKRDGR